MVQGVPGVSALARYLFIDRNTFLQLFILGSLLLYLVEGPDPVLVILSEVEGVL
jgi:hypothetical protein